MWGSSKTQVSLEPVMRERRGSMEDKGGAVTGIKLGRALSDVLESKRCSCGEEP